MASPTAPAPTMAIFIGVWTSFLWCLRSSLGRRLHGVAAWLPSSSVSTRVHGQEEDGSGMAVGRVGAGFGQAVHVPAFRLDGRARVVAVSAASVEKARAIAT